MTASFEARPSGTQIAKRSWASLFQAIPAMAPLFLTALIGFELVAILTFAGPHFSRAITLNREANITFAEFVPYTAVSLAEAIIWAALSAPVAVAMHRFILLDQVTKGVLSWAPAYTRKFFFWMAALRLVGMAVTLLSLLIVANPTARSLAIIIPEIVLLFIYVHLAMIFPAIATEMPAESWQARMAKSWNEMRGNGWLLVRAGIITFLPVVIVLIVLEFVFIGQLKDALVSPADNYSSKLLAMALVLGIFQVLGVPLAAAIASWTYAWIRQEGAV